MTFEPVHYDKTDSKTLSRVLGRVYIHDKKYQQLELEYALYYLLTSPNIWEHPVNVIIPGLLNRPDSAAGMAKELTRATRYPSLIIGYVDAVGGKVSEPFVEEVKNPVLGFKPHARIIEIILEALHKQFHLDKVALYGFSTGGPIGATLLAKSRNINGLVEKFIAITPAASVNQEQWQFNLGLFLELFGPSKISAIFHWILRNLPLQLIKYNSKIQKLGSDEVERLEMIRKASGEALSEKILKKLPISVWRQAAVHLPILVISGNRDFVVKSHDTDMYRQLNRDSSLRFELLEEEASHVTPAVEMKRFMRPILQFLGIA